MMDDVSAVDAQFDSDDGFFTSNADLQKLLSTEEAIMLELQEYIRNEETRIEKLKGGVSLFLVIWISSWYVDFFVLSSDVIDI